LNRVHIPFEIRKVDPTFFDDCCKAARQMGISLDDKKSILPYLGYGSDIAALAYGHLDYDTQVYTALYTAAAIGLEDACSNDVDLLKTFTQRFITGKIHGHPIVDSYDMLTRQLPDRFESFAAEAMLQSALDFCVGLVMEYELLKQPVRVPQYDLFLSPCLTAIFLGFEEAFDAVPNFLKGFDRN
jgi:hypothetical protein